MAGVAGEPELQRAKAALQAAGVEVIGPTDHTFVKSIYFFDPNGIRLELTTSTEAPGYLARAAERAHAECAAWIEEKSARREEAARA
jgi:hypothetical protein